LWASTTTALTRAAVFALDVNALAFGGIEFFFRMPAMRRDRFANACRWHDGVPLFFRELRLLASRVCNKLKSIFANNTIGDLFAGPECRSDRALSGDVIANEIERRFEVARLDGIDGER
jgi:hypothetical protein